MEKEKINKNLIMGLFQCLSKREAEILIRRFALRDDVIIKKEAKQTLQEVGKHFNITRERVRQIENFAIKKIKGSKKFKEIFPKLKTFTIKALKKYNGISEDNFFLNDVVKTTPPPKKTMQEILLLRNIFIFVFSKLLDDVIEEVKDLPEFKRAWKIKGASIKFSRTAVNELVKFIKEEGEPLKIEVILRKFKKTPFYLNNKSKLSDRVIFSLFYLSKKLRKNLFDEWGLVNWGSVNLKTVDDKIYYVLKKENKPLHFSEITNLINKHKIDHFKVHGATVRNILTGENKYILIGRGIYALQEWGVEPGTVTELIEKMLKRKGIAFRDEIINEILKKRIVKKQTVIIALANKKKFKQLSNKRYKLI